MDVTSEEGSAIGETSNSRKVRSSDEPPIETSAQEMSYRLKLYPDLSKVLKEKIRCTACAAPLLKEVMTGRNLAFHPILQVLLCKDCRGFYGDGDFPLDEDNSDTYCRWCAQGGNLYCCSSCNFVFCKPCIRRNFRHSMLEEIEEEDWNCFVCNPEALWKQRAICWAAMQFASSRPKKSSDEEASDDNSTKMRRERSQRNSGKRERTKNARDNDNQKKKNKRSKRYEESEDEDSSQKRSDEERKANEAKNANEEKKKAKEEKKPSEERKGSISELRRVRLSKIKDIEEDSLPAEVYLEAETRKVAMMKKTCLAMEKLTKSAQHVTNTGNRKMHELHMWISGKNASPRKQQQLSPTKLKKMMSSFSKIVNGLKEIAENLGNQVHILEEEWASVFEEGSKNMEGMANVEEIENGDITREERVNVPENIDDALETVNSLDVPSNVGNISLNETIPQSENECRLEEYTTKSVSDAETVVLDHVPSKSELSGECCEVKGVDEDGNVTDIVGEGVNVDTGNEETKNTNVEEDKAEDEQTERAETMEEDKEIGELSKSDESSKLNVSLDIFDGDFPTSSSPALDKNDREKAESVAPAVCKDLRSKVKNGAEHDKENEEKQNSCEKKFPVEDSDGNEIDDVIETNGMDGIEKEASDDAVREKVDGVECKSSENEDNRENIKPSKDDRDAKLEFLLDSSSSEESDNKLMDEVKRKKVAVVTDSTYSSDSDSESATKRDLKNVRKKKKDSEVPTEKLIETKLVAQFDDEKLKKGCSVVVKKLVKSDVDINATGKKSVKNHRKEEDAMEKAIKSLSNFSSLENPRKNKEQSNSSDSDSNSRKKSSVTKKNECKKVEENGESLEEDQSEDAPHVSTDELEMELKTVSKNDSKMDELAKNMLVENSSDSDSDFYLSAEEKKGSLKGKGKDGKPENSKRDIKASDSDFEEKSSKNSWRNNRLLRARLSETDSSEEERRWKEKKKRLESDSDEEMESKVKSRSRRARVMSSSSDEKITSGGLSSDYDSDEDAKKRKRGPKSDSSEQSSSASKIKKKKKRRRIQLVDSNSDTDERKKEDTDIEEIDEKSGKGRKNIRKVIKHKMLGEDAKQAAKDEEDRKKRISERQKLYNEFFVNKEKEATVDKLVLDFDPDTKEELVAVHPDLVKKLTPHQAEGIKFMWDACFESLKMMETEKGSGCILAHCMGLGKTLQVVALVHTLLQNPKINMKTVLVICPLNTVLNWVNEFEIWLKDLNSGHDIEIFELNRFKANVERMYQLKDWQSSGGVMILGYDMYRGLLNGRNRRKKVQEAFISTLADPGPDLVICDEGHLLKNLQSALSKAVNSIKTARRIVLTGTPLQNNLKEYHCMIQFVKPNLLGNLKEFLNRFVNPISNGQCADSTPHDVKIMKRRAHVLHKMLDGCVQRRDFSVMIPYLPPKHEYVVCICLTELQSKLYTHYIQNFSQRGSGGGTTLFNDFQNLQRIWTHPRVLKMSTEKKELRKMMQSDSEGSLKDFICDNTEESDTTETSSDSSSHNKAKKRKKLKRTCKDDDSSSSASSDVICVEKETEEKEGNQEDIEKVDTVPLGQKDWWESFIQPEDHDKIIHSGKLMLLMTILKKCENIGDKILLFSQSLYTLDLIEYFLEYVDSLASKSQSLEQSTEEGEEHSFQFKGSWEKGIDYFRIDGSVSGENRSMWCKCFNREDNFRARLFLISTKAGGMGINLVGANRVILFDASWNPSNDVQSIYRVYRFGQKKPCYVYRFLAQGTMEEKIYNRQVTKLSLASRVLDEHQIERHYSFGDLQELYSYEPTDMSKRPTPIIPKDRLLAELIQSYPNLIYNYHEHDSLLQNIAEEELTEEERKAAWDDFENEKQGKIPENLPQAFGAVLNSSYMGGVPYPMPNVIPGLMEALLKKYPNASQEHLASELRLVNNQLTQYFPKHRLQMFNQMVPENVIQQQHNLALYPEMRQRFEQSFTMDEHNYQNYMSSPYFQPSANSSHLAPNPVNIQNLQQYASNPQTLPSVKVPVLIGANKDTLMKRPTALEESVNEGKLKIRTDLMNKNNDDNDVIIESVRRRK